MAFLDEKFLIKPPMTEFMLLDFETYEDYLDSLYTIRDKCYLADREMCRRIAEFGYRRDGLTFSREEFTQKRAKVLAYLAPVNPTMMASAGLRYGDPAQIALALRERANRVGLLATIIFVNYTTPTGRDISGYIDFAHSLLLKNWTKFFKESEAMVPDRFDLGFYDWRKGVAASNDSLNFKTLMSPEKGLVFQHKFDRKLITPDPFSDNAGSQTTRVRMPSKLYNCFVVIDHTLRVRK